MRNLVDEVPWSIAPTNWSSLETVMSLIKRLKRPVLELFYGPGMDFGDGEVSLTSDSLKH